MVMPLTLAFPLLTSTNVHSVLVAAWSRYGTKEIVCVIIINVSKLQSIRNAVACLIGGIPRFVHISTFISDTLHWLLVHQPIQFKIVTFSAFVLLALALTTFCTLSNWVSFGQLPVAS